MAAPIRIFFKYFDSFCNSSSLFEIWPLHLIRSKTPENDEQPKLDSENEPGSPAGDRLEVLSKEVFSFNPFLWTLKIFEKLLELMEIVLVGFCHFFVLEFRGVRRSLRRLRRSQHLPQQEHETTMGCKRKASKGSPGSANRGNIQEPFLLSRIFRLLSYIKCPFAYALDYRKDHSDDETPRKRKRIAVHVNVNTEEICFVNDGYKSDEDPDYELSDVGSTDSLEYKSNSEDENEEKDKENDEKQSKENGQVRPDDQGNETSEQEHDLEENGDSETEVSKIEEENNELDREIAEILEDIHETIKQQNESISENQDSEKEIENNEYSSEDSRDEHSQVNTSGENDEQKSVETDVRHEEINGHVEHYNNC